MKRYEYALKALKDALENYAENHELKNMSHSEIARHVLNFCNETFNYEKVEHQRVVHFLQGLGLDIPFYNCDILELAKKDGRECMTERQEQNTLNRYWSFMAMRLKQIAKEK